MHPVSPLPKEVLERAEKIGNVLKMLEDIDALVQTDFCADMTTRHGFREKFSQEEADEMAGLIGQIYMISHTLTCKSCRK